MKIAIIGCGLIGRKRALALSPDDVLVVCCDTSIDLAIKLAKEFNAEAVNSYKKILENYSVDAVIVAVVNKFATQIISDFLSNGIHILAEKPLGRNHLESSTILEVLNDSREKSKKYIVCKTGFNHRYHPAIFKAQELLTKGNIGSTLYIRANYGHGGRPGMENEWRSSKDLCGGGELLDQGVHIIDLCNWFSGADKIRKVYATIKTKFWPIEVEDNAFIIMESASGIDYQVHVSWTNWKNNFIYEIYGTEGFLKIQGLGGSYGTETLTIGIRNPLGGAPALTEYEFPQIDKSWELEWQDFKNAIILQTEPLGSALDGHRANLIIQALYNSHESNSPIFLD